ncbi:MAG: 50S ribosomal protein L3 N(5)-glutamine methyltransferase [Gammaproteobacteria bacterium]|nr:50S ribosomal protein L3 N(5)-glutamine methyltransferase [Gammaproteobacteria bacterium]
MHDNEPPVESLEALDTRLRTIRDWLRYGASAFNAAKLSFGHGTDNALDEALALVLHTLHLGPPELDASWLDARVSAAEAGRIHALFERRIRERIPAAYLTREAWFAGLRFYVDERVVIPRSPLAELIEARIEPWLAREPRRILDLCCGSGCIGIAAALAFPEAEVVLADCDPGALEVAQCNVLEYGLENRLQLAESDLFEDLDERPFDLVLANPPYVDEPAYAALAQEYRHEPRTGLESGPLGLDHPLRILAATADRLTAGGLLVLEVGATQPALERALPNLDMTWVEFERGGEGVAVVTREALIAPDALEVAA